MTLSSKNSLTVNTFKALSTDLVIEVHNLIIAEYGGLSGICPDRSLESALLRSDNAMLYEGVSDLFEIAAFYAIAIAQGHVFNDGNKRTAFTCTLIFLKINGYETFLPYDEAEDTMVLIAEKNFHANK